MIELKEVYGRQRKEFNDNHQPRKNLNIIQEHNQSVPHGCRRYLDSGDNENNILIGLKSQSEYIKKVENWKCKR